MGKIYWNLHEIPIPKGARIFRSSNQIVHIYRDSNGKRRKLIIGTLITNLDGTYMMHPNENFKYIYPQLWKEHYNQDSNTSYEIHAGLFALVLGVAHKIGLYPLLYKVFGPEQANALMDFAMFSIANQSNSAYLFSDAMTDQLLFSRKALDDNWYSNFFTLVLDSNKINEFRYQWLNLNSQKNITKVWLCIDGSNDDCLMKNSEYAEPGNAKSGNNVNIVSFIWAVCANSGRPIAWMVNPGGMHDAKAFDGIIKVLEASNVKIEGVILDRGFVSQDVINLIEKLGFELIIKLKSSTAAYKKMIENYDETIRNHVEHLVWNNSDGVKFGITDEMQLFNDSSNKYCVGLFFDPTNSNARSTYFLYKLIDERKELEAMIARGSYELPEIPDKFKSCFEFEVDASGKITAVKPKEKYIQNLIDTKGYSAIASSKRISPEEMLMRYGLRDCSEKQYAILKSQLNGGVIRVHRDNAMLGRFFVAFIASILRTEIMLACQEMKYDINEVLRKVNRARIMLMPNGKYQSIFDHPQKIEKLFKYFGVSRENFLNFAEELNLKSDNIQSSQYHMLSSPSDSSQVGSTPKRKPGRPKGSKNKATLEREKIEAQNPPAPKRGRGRPLGSKNKATLEKEANKAFEQNKPTRRPGRPKGSLNKKTLAKMGLKTEPIVKHSRPGRPKGSKNKVTLEREAKEAQHLRRKPGRPKGSKNTSKMV